MSTYLCKGCSFSIVHKMQENKSELYEYVWEETKAVRQRKFAYVEENRWRGRQKKRCFEVIEWYEVD